eukprot:TRINITY_DN7482_c0_g1_i1.p1 TRINITY_DN7482_c0_g1~~TRINITY_DN7482_c0_g1_i1.p1  ORF type:complete len:174 (-),score=40.85 TRINITY_DN7482_c0_g1_i1:271-792(-)
MENRRDHIHEERFQKAEQESMLRWGKRKRLNRVKVQNSKANQRKRKDSPKTRERSNKFQKVENGGSSSNDEATKGGRHFSNSKTEEETLVWPKLIICLTSEEKEKDFMEMKGSKLPQRPKKRSKFVQKSIHLLTPGAWLADLTQDRYEVQEKKTAKKKAKGLRAMKNLKSDSE